MPTFFELFAARYEKLLQSKYGGRVREALGDALPAAEEAWRRLGPLVDSIDGLGAVLLGDAPTYAAASSVARNNVVAAALFDRYVPHLEAVAPDDSEKDYLTRQLAAFYFIVKSARDATAQQ